MGVFGTFPETNEERDAFVNAIRGFQNSETGLFVEATHHPIHTTAHCIAALELFDAKPLYPPKELSQALHGVLKTKKPLNLVLDRRPFI